MLAFLILESIRSSLENSIVAVDLRDSQYPMSIRSCVIHNSTDSPTGLMSQKDFVRSIEEQAFRYSQFPGYDLALV